ncbi:MAG: cyanophycin synthetase [Planctomycetota bacterium]|nr:cyanophycin synthetase [Planctomycetota bacterium]
MRITATSVYVGPNRYANFRVIRLVLDLQELEAWPSARLGEKFTGGLVEALPGLAEHGCSYGEPGGFVRRLNEDEGTWLGHVLEHVAIELQNVAGLSVTFGKTRSAGETGVYDVVYEYEDEEVGVEAGRLALTLLHSLLPEELKPSGEDAVPEGFDFVVERDEFIRFAQRRALGPSTASLVKAAEERDIPWLRLNKYSLVQFGHGCHQRRIQATVTSETRHIAVEIASDKEETNRILGDLGLPVPRQEMVYDVERAVRAARRIGYPVVVKPLDANHGRGVSINLMTEEEVRVAFDYARKRGRTILVESFIHGEDHRMLVVDGCLISVAKRVPGHVVGDGKHTIEELVATVNEDPRRGIGHEKILTRLEFDHQAERLLEQKGLNHESVPDNGVVVPLRSTGNLSTGGTAEDVTNIVHPDNVEMAVRSVKAIGLDVGGVDFLTSDISQSFKETGGAICEVNAAPGFRMHVAPSKGDARDVAGPVMDMLFPPGSPSRIPIASITGTNGKTTTTRMVAQICKMAQHKVGLATTDGVYIDGRLTVEGDMTGPTAARMILRDSSVDVAVLETARGGILRRGVGYRRCTVGAVLNVQSDHLGLRGIDTVEQLAEVKRTVVEIAKDTAVLNADDPLCLEMADHCTAEHICYVTVDNGHAIVKEHIRAGGRAVGIEQGIGGSMITIYDRGAHMPLLWAHLVPATLDGRAFHNVLNSMFAAAISFSMGVELEDIRQGLLTFDTTFFQVPGRMNIFDEHPFKVILDYGHNPAAVQAMIDLSRQLDVSGRRILVIAAPGDRRDVDVREIGRICAGNFQEYICRRDDVLRGRGDDEIPRILQESLLENGVPADQIQVVPQEQDAVLAALSAAQEGDLVLIFGDAIARSWQQITTFEPSAEIPRSKSDADRSDSPSQRSTEQTPAMAFDLRGRELIHDERGVRLRRELED